MEEFLQLVQERLNQNMVLRGWTYDSLQGLPGTALSVRSVKPLLLLQAENGP